jgi:PLD-like domain
MQRAKGKQILLPILDEIVRRACDPPKPLLPQGELHERLWKRRRGEKPWPALTSGTSRTARRLTDKLSARLVTVETEAAKMLHFKILHPVQIFEREFRRCCREYDSLQFATAWCGNPENVLPYEHLKGFPGHITATVGRHFDNTHPDAMTYLLHLNVDLRVFRKEIGLFHPKVYLFSSQERIAVFVGSSNLTYSGFYSNVELNVLLEGVPDNSGRAQVNKLQKQLGDWHTDAFSFVPDAEWIANYRKAFNKALEAEKRNRIQTPPLYENEIASASWLRNATWETFYQKVLEGLEQNKRSANSYLDVLTAARDRLPLPWNTAVFDDLESRRIVLGGKRYGWLGNVGASGRFKKLLSRGTQHQRKALVDAVNRIGSLNAPLVWNALAEELEKLVRLGPTMKVWSRLLCLVRPDLYCTIASIPVRTNLSKTLGFPQTSFERPAGYIELLKLLHASPWFQSPAPTEETEREVWLRRVAFLDAIFYTRK